MLQLSRAKPGDPASMLYIERRGSVVERRGSILERCGSVVVSTSAWHAAGQGFDSRTRHVSLLGVKTWLSTLEIVYPCVFRRRR